MITGQDIEEAVQMYILHCMSRKVKVQLPDGELVVLTPPKAVQYAVDHATTGCYKMAIHSLDHITKDDAIQCYLLQEEITGEDEDEEVEKHEHFLYERGIELIRNHHKWTWVVYMFLVEQGYDVPRRRDGKTAIELKMAIPT